MLDFPKMGFAEILGETRLLGEYLRFRGDSLARDSSTSDARNANSHWRPVLLIPGFMASDASLYPLGARLRSQGHRVFYAGIWMNADCPAKTLERLSKRIREISFQTGRKVAIIGHSLGGIYARELARREPELVEQIFLLGSPVKHALGNTTPFLRPLVAAMRFMHRGCMDGVSEACKTCGLDLPQSAPDVPETCIYTKTDGIVEWHSCIEEGPRVECVEVDSSHCGIPLNFKTWDAISKRLSVAAQEANPMPATGTPLRSRALPPRTPHVTRASHLKLVARKGDAA
jgi:triacylglycerol lipase